MAEQRDELIPTRATLLVRLKDPQDHASWQVFYDTYSNLIYGVAVKSGLTDAEAKDVVQETLIAVAKNIPAFQYDQSVGSFKGWLLNMTRWRVVDHLRKRKGHAAAGGASPETESGTREIDRVVDPASHTLDKIWDHEWEQNLVAAATAKIKRQFDPGKFQIFDFYMNKDWPPEKVAKSFGISVDQVYLTKHRILELIKTEVQRLRDEMV